MSTNTSSSFTRSLSALAFAFGAIGGVAQAETLTIVLSGDAAPGTSANFSSFDAPVLNDNGQAAYFADLTGAGVVPANDRGIWHDNALIARTKGADSDAHAMERRSHHRDVRRRSTLSSARSPFTKPSNSLHKHCSRLRA